MERFTRGGPRTRHGFGVGAHGWRGGTEHQGVGRGQYARYGPRGQCPGAGRAVGSRCARAGQTSQDTMAWGAGIACTHARALACRRKGAFRSPLHAPLYEGLCPDFFQKRAGGRAASPSTKQARAYVLAVSFASTAQPPQGSQACLHPCSTFPIKVFAPLFSKSGRPPGPPVPRSPSPARYPCCLTTARVASSPLISQAWA